MATFTIDTDNNIVAHVGVPPASEQHQVFSTEAELATLAAKWPATRPVKIWNSFAGAAPFNDLKPVKKFTSRSMAVARIWQAIARLEPAVAPSPENTLPRKKPTRSNFARQNSPEASLSKKAKVIAIMRQAKGATLDSIMQTTGWQKHTVRGFLSVLGRKGALKIESSLNSAGLRSYKIAK